VVNEIWSDVVYMHRMYVPIGVIETDEQSPKVLTTGIGSLLKVPMGGSYTYANPQIDFRGVLEPMSVALELALADSAAPAMSVGLGHMFGSAARSVNTPSGVAKAMEWTPTVRRAKLKRGPFERGIKDMIHKTLTMMAAPKPYGQGIKRVKPDAKITTHWPQTIEPISAAERLEMLAKEVVIGVTSAYQGMIDHKGWSPERAQRELDMIAVEKRNLYAEIGAKHVVEAIMDRHTSDIPLSEEDKKRIFGQQLVMASDKEENQREAVNDG